MPTENDHAGAEPPVLSLEECPHCGELVPVGAFCGNCGAALTEEGGGSRLGSYAASPGEHVVRPALISTLFPHLPHRHAHTFREAFGIGLLVVLLLAAIHLYTSALIAASVLLPILYLIYLYEVEVYQHEPIPVVLATFGVGAVLGVAYTLLAGHLVSGALSGTRQGVFVSGVVLPIFIQLLMIAGPLLLLSRAHFNEALDGLTFGVSAALGFTLASVITGYWHVFTAPLQGSDAVSTTEILGLIRAGILVAIVNAATTGMITAALWLRVHRRSRGRHISQWRGLEATLAVGFGAQIALGVIGYYIGSLLGLVLLYVVAAALLLIWLRVILHHALLDEGADLHIGDPTACPECHRLVPTMVFCPACGATRSVGPKQARHQPSSETATDAG
jgi:RNA polymerase subunit RPABC4/transcription elongation factor Spt4